MSVRQAVAVAWVTGPQTIRRSCHRGEGSIVILGVDPLTDLIRDSITQDRMVAQVVSGFGVVALVLATLGLHGVMAYATARRTNEFGLRIALGAEQGRVTRLVLREAMTLALAGVAIGLPLALASTRLLRQQLFGIGSLDLPSIALAILVLAGSAALAG